MPGDQQGSGGDGPDAGESTVEGRSPTVTAQNRGRTGFVCGGGGRLSAVVNLRADASTSSSPGMSKARCSR